MSLLLPLTCGYYTIFKHTFILPYHSPRYDVLRFLHCFRFRCRYGWFPPERLRPEIARWFTDLSPSNNPTRISTCLHQLAPKLPTTTLLAIYPPVKFSFGLLSYFYDFAWWAMSRNFCVCVAMRNGLHMWISMYVLSRLHYALRSPNISTGAGIVGGVIVPWASNTRLLSSRLSARQVESSRWTDPRISRYHTYYH